MEIKKINIIITLILLIILLCINTYSIAIDEIITTADDFLREGAQKRQEIMNDTDLRELSRDLYDIFFIVGVIIAAIIGMVLGIQYITGTVEQQGKVKEALIPYLVGLAVAVGAYTIWRIVVLTLNKTV